MSYLDGEEYSWHREGEGEYREYAEDYGNHNGQHQIIARFVGVQLWPCILHEERRRRKNRRRKGGMRGGRGEIGAT